MAALTIDWGANEVGRYISGLIISSMLSAVKRQQNYLRAKYGGVEDEMHDEEEDDKEEKKAVWGGMKNQYYYGDNRDFEVRI